MDLKYNLARARLLRDRSPLPITTLEVIKDSSEFVNLASSEHHGRVLFSPFLNRFHSLYSKRAFYIQAYLRNSMHLYCEMSHSAFPATYGERAISVTQLAATSSQALTMLSFTLNIFSTELLGKWDTACLLLFCCNCRLQLITRPFFSMNLLFFQQAQASLPQTPDINFLPFHQRLGR